MANKYVLVCCFIIIAMFLLGGCQGTTLQPELGVNSDNTMFRLVESDGTEFVRDTIPERIIVISFPTAEIMDRLGIELVGVTKTTRELPDNLAGLPTVGFPMEPDIEVITALEPDLVIISSDFKDTHKDKMVQNNLPVYFLDNQSYEDTFNSIELLGKAFGKEETAGQLIKEMKEREKEIVNSVKGKPSPKVLILFGTGESFMMGTETSYPGGLVKMLGGQNVTQGVNIPLESGYIPLSIEQVVELNPDIILRVAHASPEHTQALYEYEFSRNPIWDSVAAHQNNRVYDLPQNLFFANAGLYVVDALEYLVEILYL
ncbi:ABC transporter substrate-binding protein [Candidatus Contubernalis alkaliaceticus]|uniref:ABC transporter substrate-binding protein n=1 Tax=Candidatus Contubernalis alkaliaceticus TaxID=338645 RepID=UPI001F4BDDD4|nr:ABC transporter substrate-binding protein [Candidatus Contubernalis alkalaceticus]UNC93078.1 ABC transporter substrate-binding protein [Candidatus Contubernalis alkalaceticus]